ncbi:folate-binding protein YgfZ [Lysobacter sp. K5869]|uniref:CAF17-like 4Fe-4S cluster assembly/insertion protein YgfZ n=1 Tax=Lysobacter sp. K5869 TaxID=2820808 RepID=UPI001C0631AD|nr:folate-binding protein [Lysobacter sp. K5869]QWP74901.1 folate-binding protein YgfZ [Lysobacter sp. K5869]
MPDNPQALPGQAFALPGQRLIALEGRDAAAFAQAQFMNAVKALADGHWQWSGWLTPKGRAIALFALLRLSDQRIWLAVPDADAAALVEALKRFVFRSKLALGVREDLVIEGRFGAPERAAGAAIAGDGDGPVEIDLSADGAARALRIVPAAQAAAADAALAAQWALADLRHGLPRLPASQAEQWTPQQLSLDRLRGYSVKKGCYPGQEIVARTHFLGKAKRGLALFACPAPVEAGAEVRGESAALGTVAASASDGATHLALAVLPLERAEGAAFIDAQPVQEIPLLDGLAR